MDNRSSPEVSNLTGLPPARQMFEATPEMNHTNNDTAGIGNETLEEVNKGVLVTLMVFIMLSMGATISWKQVWEHVRRPVGALIGLFCQFVMMPFVGYSLKYLLNVTGLFAVGVVIVSCSPGGAISNNFTYYLEGDVALSVTMTTLSTILALGMMPLNLIIYGPNVEVDNIKIPYEKMALSIVIVTSPLVVGMLIKWKFPSVALYVTKVGSLAGFILIGVSIGLEVVLFPNMFANAPQDLYLFVTLMPLIGAVFGYCMSWLCRRNVAVRKTVAIESGIQNIGVSLTIISLSFKGEVLESILTFPVLYGVLMTSVFLLLSSTYQAYRKLCYSPADEKQKGLEEKKEEEAADKREPVILVSYLTTDERRCKPPLPFTNRPSAELQT